MPSEILFISDLHLALEKPEITRRFLHFLQTRATQAQALYILGDLFDAWIGDDDNTRPIPAIKQALRELTAAGTRVFLLQGNRDFLLGAAFSRATGVELLDEYAVIDLDGKPVLLTHGDLLCTDDVAYQAFREKSHSPAWQRNVLSKPLLVRLLAARWYRLRSHFHKRGKSLEIMDVNQDAVIAALRRHQCLTLVHGHTHRPAHHRFLLDGREAERLVLAEWKGEAGGALSWRGGSWREEQV